jgi:Zn finger protein HypA/HybF involved in hydrogenase expression
MGVAIIDSAASRSGLSAGASARGEFHCSECGYGITVHRALPTCPMCRGTEWLAWSGRQAADDTDTADLGV